MGRSNAIILDKKEVKGFLKNIDTDTIESFKIFLEEKTKKKFEVSKSLIFLNIFDIVDIFRKGK